MAASRGGWVLLVVCLFGFHDVLCSSDSLRNATVKEGQDALLPCTLPPQSKMLYKVTWFKGPTKYITKKAIPPMSTSKYVRREIAIDNQYGLLIKATNLQDSGEYTCKALYLGTPFETANSKIILFVKAKPIIVSSIPPVFTLIQTTTPKDLVLDCRATGYPKPSISWIKHNGALPTERASKTENGSLVITKATKGDGGEYSCVATNEMGTDDKNFTITVLEPPRIIGKTKFHFNAGVNAKLECTSLGNPQPKFTWSWKDIENNTVSLKDGEDDSRRRVSTIHGNESSVSTLTIDSITIQDWATYHCHVWNKLGKDDRDVILTGYTKPQSPHILAVKTGHDTAQVEWEFGDDGGLALESLTLQYKSSSEREWKSVQISPPDTTTYTINKLKADTNYNFRVQATNQLGSSPPSAIYLAKTALKESSVDALSDGSDKGLLGGVSMTVLVGAVAGGFLFLLFVILGVLCSIRRMQKRNDHVSANGPSTPQDTTEMTAFLPNQTQMPEMPGTTENTTVNPLSNSRWEFPRDRIRTSVVLGSGAFGVVMKADAQGIKGCVGSLPVAIKIVKETDSDTARRDLLAELDLLKLIDPHPNVIGLLGCCTRGDPLMVIVEFCQYGDLQSYLRHCRGIEDKYYEQIYQTPEKKLSSKDLLSFGIQAARGMAHLASMKVVHRDLAARNILIDNKNVCKVSDFGFARDIYVEDHYTRKTQGGRFPIKWMAIESLLDGVSTTKSDVWSYAVLLWEVVTLGASPYPGMNSQEVITFLQDGYRMDKPKHCADELYCIMLDCWQVLPQRRPTFVEISRHLNKMLTDERDFISMRMYEDHVYMNFDSRSSTFPGGSSQPLNTFF